MYFIHLVKSSPSTLLRRRNVHLSRLPLVKEPRQPWHNLLVRVKSKARLTKLRGATRHVIIVCGAATRRSPCRRLSALAD
jgi:hypothetical protein